MSKIILILGDQLSLGISSLRKANKEDLIVMMELASETNYVKHHKRKMVFLFSAMRHFSKELLEHGFSVKYLKLDDSSNMQSFSKNLKQILREDKYKKVLLTEPSEYRLLELLKTELTQISCDLEILEDDRFLISKHEFKEFAGKQKNLKLENFYRYMRKKSKYLMDGDKPQGGKWNFDHDNRSAYDAKNPIPGRPKFNPDDVTQEVIKLINSKFPERFGTTKEFYEAVTRNQALIFLKFFTEKCLKNFGKYQDAMVEKESFMFHSRISHLINCGLLTPTEVCEAVIGKINECPIASIEGFIRQIIGWREYIRGVYWLYMPEYINSNFFNNSAPLPEFYWSGECRMNCISEVINSTRKTAYSHHIQRLMITGNLALLMGLSPKEVHEWYLAVYDDAYEWVELPNTFGMALFADGGLMATKPYISSGNYINKMSNYCKNCSYNVKEKTGKSACPFNYLYWNFLEKHKDKLSNNRRLFMPYRNLDKKSNEELEQIKRNSEDFLEEHLL